MTAYALSHIIWKLALEDLGAPRMEQTCLDFMGLVGKNWKNVVLNPHTENHEITTEWGTKYQIVWCKFWDLIIYISSCKKD